MPLMSLFPPLTPSFQGPQDRRVRDEESDRVREFVEGSVGDDSGSSGCLPSIPFEVVDPPRDVLVGGGMERLGNRHQTVRITDRISGFGP